VLPVTTTDATQKGSAVVIGRPFTLVDPAGFVDGCCCGAGVGCGVGRGAATIGCVAGFATGAVAGAVVAVVPASAFGVTAASVVVALASGVGVSAVVVATVTLVAGTTGGFTVSFDASPPPLFMLDAPMMPRITTAAAAAA
jgi:hypothetical protein